VNQDIKQPEEESLEGMPRFIKSWKQAYGLLLLFLGVLIVLFYLFSEAWA